MRLLNSEEMKQVEQFTVRFGLSYQRMMENAGAACARNIRNIIEGEKIHGRNVVVICGKGNNGGDGFVVARKMAENGYNVSIVLASGYPTSAEATYMFKLILDFSISTLWYETDKAKVIQTIKGADIIVDAVYGFSFYGALSDEMAELFSLVNSAMGKIFSIDLPSGVYCDRGYNAKGCIRADYTIAVSALKPAHIIHPAADFCGKIIIANIGIPEESYQMVEDSLYTYNKVEVGNLFPQREDTANKGSFGHLLCICGSRCMVGAPVLVGSAALRSGAGLVTMAFPESAYLPIASKLTEALMMPLPETSEGTLSEQAIKKLLPVLDKYDGIVIGPGMGVNEDTAKVLEAVISNAKIPVIIDADGLNIIAKNPEILNCATSQVVLTPHPKEMSRLVGTPVEIIQSDRFSFAREFADRYRVYVALKGSNTVVAAPQTRKVYVNASGNSGLSKGGSGDVLAGLMGGFAVQGFSFSDAIISAVYVHGYTGDAVSMKTSKSGMLPCDVVQELKYTLRDFEK